VRALGRTAAAVALGVVTMTGTVEAETAVPEGARLPDIIEEIPKHLGIWNVQQHEVLRFTTTHWNFGDGPLQVHGGGQVGPCEIDGVAYPQCTIATQEILDAAGDVVATQPAGVSLFHPEHNHWHQDAVAEFAIRTSPDGPPVGGQTILKTTFCLIDSDMSKDVKGSDKTYSDCNGDLQGISVGWGDEYHHSTQGQAIDITGLPAGIYYLTQEADPDGHWLELDDTNNTSWVEFRLERTSANPKLTVLDSFGYEGNTSNK
jgi:hypothetical protein